MQFNLYSVGRNTGSNFIGVQSTICLLYRDSIDFHEPIIHSFLVLVKDFHRVSKTFAQKANNVLRQTTSNHLILHYLITRTCGENMSTASKDRLDSRILFCFFDSLEITFSVIKLNLVFHQYMIIDEFYLNYS